jgi:hypothetical protein
VSPTSLYKPPSIAVTSIAVPTARAFAPAVLAFLQQLLRTDRPALVFIGVGLREYAGHELLDRCRMAPARRELPGAG